MFLLQKLEMQMTNLQHVPDPKEHFTEIEGLRQEVLGSAGQGPLLRVRRYVSSEHQHR